MSLSSAAAHVVFCFKTVLDIESSSKKGVVFLDGWENWSRKWSTRLMNVCVIKVMGT